jgi:hypothetical protein
MLSITFVPALQGSRTTRCPALILATARVEIPAATRTASAPTIRPCDKIQDYYLQASAAGN